MGSPAVSMSSPRSRADDTTLAAVPCSPCSPPSRLPNSMATIRPRPRTSTMAGNFAASATSPWSPGGGGHLQDGCPSQGLQLSALPHMAATMGW